MPKIAPRGENKENTEKQTKDKKVSVKMMITSRRASAYELISVKITRTCLPHSYAKYSAVVKAIRGVMIRSIVGSLAYKKC